MQLKKISLLAFLLCTAILLCAFQSWFQGMNQRWKSQENYCHVCLENMEPTSIIKLDYMNEDKNYVFKQVGMKYDLIMSFKHKYQPGSKEHFSIDEVTQKR